MLGFFLVFFGGGGWHCCLLLILEPMVSRLVILEGALFVKIALSQLVEYPNSLGIMSPSDFHFRLPLKVKGGRVTSIGDEESFSQASWEESPPSFLLKGAKL